MTIDPHSKWPELQKIKLFTKTDGRHSNEYMAKQAGFVPLTNKFSQRNEDGQDEMPLALRFIDGLLGTNTVRVLVKDVDYGTAFEFWRHKSEMLSLSYDNQKLNEEIKE